MSEAVASKQCAGCEADKPVNAFYLDRGKLRSICKDCYRTHNRSQREKHATKRNAYDRSRGNGWNRSGRAKWNITEREKHDAHLRRTYGITIDQYDAMFAAQGHVCAICKGECNRSNSDRLCVDHDHATGAVRGLLCFQCNVGLGKFKDNPALLKSALKYLGERE